MTDQPGIIKGGAVYRCKVDSPQQACEVVPFDIKGKTWPVAETYIHCIAVC